jgi:hypothetical protein
MLLPKGGLKKKWRQPHRVTASTLFSHIFSPDVPFTFFSAMAILYQIVMEKARPKRGKRGVPASVV